MKIKTHVIASALGLAVCGSALGQDRPGGARDQAPRQPGDAASATAHIAEAYANVAPFDVNRDGLLDEGELRDLGQAMLAGEVQEPKHRIQPEGDEPAHPGIIIRRIVGLYRVAFSFDKDKDGLLSETERDALTGAIENGEVRRPGGPGGGRPPGVGGRPF